MGMMRIMGLQLSESELDAFFGRIDASGDGFIVFEELVEFLQKIARPITLEEELIEAFRFFNPDPTREDIITKRDLAKVMTSMGEDISEAECGDMIFAATGGVEVIDFETFQRFCKPARHRGHNNRL